MAGVKRPFRGPTESDVDPWIGCSRKLSEKIRWSAQVNVRNIGVGNRLIPVSAQPDVFRRGAPFERPRAKHGLPCAVPCAESITHFPSP